MKNTLDTSSLDVIHRNRRGFIYCLLSDLHQTLGYSSGFTATRLIERAKTELAQIRPDTVDIHISPVTDTNAKVIDYELDYIGCYYVVLNCSHTKYVTSARKYYEAKLTSLGITIPSRVEVGQEIDPKHRSIFDNLSRYGEDLIAYWRGRTYLTALGYSSWSNSGKTLAKAIEICTEMGQDPALHFVEITRLINCSTRAVSGADYKLSRLACYLIAKVARSKPISISARLYFSEDTQPVPSFSKIETVEPIVETPNTTPVTETVIEPVVIAAIVPEIIESSSSSVIEKYQPPAAQIESKPDAIFDEIRGYLPDGSEYWTAREVMRRLGFGDWESFHEVVKDAILDIDNIDMGTAKNHIRYIPKLANRPQGGGNHLVDYEMTRLGCYHVALACKTRTLEVSVARRYFAVHTRIAEVAMQNMPTTETGWIEFALAKSKAKDALQLELQASEQARVEATQMTLAAERATIAAKVAQKVLEEQIEEDSEYTNFGKIVALSSTDVLVSTVAKMSGIVGGKILMESLREMGILQNYPGPKIYNYGTREQFTGQDPRHNAPKSDYIKRGLMKSVPCIVQHKHATETRFTTYVTAKGQPWVIKKYCEWVEKQKVIDQLAYTGIETQLPLFNPNVPIPSH